MEENFIYYFYKTVNMVNGRYYYGIHSHFKDKVDKYMGSGVALEAAIKKYGIECFKKEIIKYFPNREEALLYERQIVDEQVVRDPMSYNIAIGGSGGILNEMMPAESKNKKYINTKKYWLQPGIKLSRGNAIKNSNKWQKGIKRIVEEGVFKGINNPSHKIAIKKYLAIKNQFCYLALNTDLPLKTMADLVGFNGHTQDIVSYFEFIAALPTLYNTELCSRYLSFKGERPDGGSLRNIYVSNPEYKMIFFYPKYFNLFSLLKSFECDITKSDSAARLSRLPTYISGYDHIINYFKECGVLKDVRVEQIHVRVQKNLGLSYYLPSTKTRFNFDPSGLNKIIFDRELNIYGINDNGEPFRQGRFELGKNGRWGVYGCNGKKYKNSKFQP